MPKPYVEPAMRRKMGMDSPAAPAAPMMDQPEGGADESPAAESDEDSEPTAFLPKEIGGGKQYQPGDQIVLTVDAVDPETGELQVSCATDEDEPAPATDASPMDNFDKSMPETGE